MGSGGAAAGDEEGDQWWQEVEAGVGSGSGGEGFAGEPCWPRGDAQGRVGQRLEGGCGVRV